MAFAVFTTNITPLQTMYGIMQRGRWRDGDATTAFYAAFLSFVAQLLFYTSLAVLLFFEAIQEFNRSPQ